MLLYVVDNNCAKVSVPHNNEKCDKFNNWFP